MVNLAVNLMRPELMAQRVSPAVSWMSSFSIRCVRCLSTVLLEMPSSAAVCLLALPSAISRSTSNSREVSWEACLRVVMSPKADRHHFRAPLREIADLARKLAQKVPPPSRRSSNSQDWFLGDVNTRFRKSRKFDRLVEDIDRQSDV